MKRFTLTILLAFILGFNAFADETKWAFDKPHTSVTFTISHMVVTDVVGKFNDWKGSLTAPGEDFENSAISFTIQTASIDTDNEKRNKHLRSADFFDAEKNPEITFNSTSFTKTGEGKFKLVGDLNMHGVTKPVELDVKFRGTVKDPWGNTRAGFKATGEIERYDFDLKYNSTLEAGGLLIGKTVEIEINAELIKQ